MSGTRHNVELLDLAGGVGQERFSELANDESVVITKTMDALDSKTGSGLRVVDYVRTEGTVRGYVRPIC